MNKKVDPFIDFLPKIDLHGYDRVSARIKVDEFINDSYKLKYKKIVIIHGIGTGTLKNEVHSCLKHNKLVEKYNLYWNNPGLTEVSLK